MFISVQASKLNQVNEVLRDHNIHNTLAIESVVGGVQYVHLRDDNIAIDVLNKLKVLGAFIAITGSN